MFTLESVIDQAQNSQKEFIKTFVKHDAIAKSLTELVDSHATATRSVVKVSTQLAKDIGSEAIKAAQEVGKFDFTKFTAPKA
jgi:succinyl-CoA synthetase alpha subunit